MVQAGARPAGGQAGQPAGRQPAARHMLDAPGLRPAAACGGEAAPPAAHAHAVQLPRLWLHAERQCGAPAPRPCRHHLPLPPSRRRRRHTAAALRPSSSSPPHSLVGQRDQDGGDGRQDGGHSVLPGMEGAHSQGVERDQQGHNLQGTARARQARCGMARRRVWVQMRVDVVALGARAALQAAPPRGGSGPDPAPSSAER